MAEYIPTFQACNLLGLSKSSQLSSKYKIRFQRQLSYKLWNMDDIQAVLDKRKRDSVPPKGWMRLKEVAKYIGRSPGISRSILMAYGIKPEAKRLWIRNKYRLVPCWSKLAVREVIGQIRATRRKTPPEGWLTFADCMDYLSVSKDKTRSMLKRFNVGYQILNTNRRYYVEADVIAMRKAIKTTTISCPKPEKKS